MDLRLATLTMVPLMLLNVRECPPDVAVIHLEGKPCQFKKVDLLTGHQSSDVVWFIGNDCEDADSKEVNLEKFQGNICKDTMVVVGKHKTLAATCNLPAGGATSYKYIVRISGGYCEDPEIVIIDDGRPPAVPTTLTPAPKCP